MSASQSSLNPFLVTAFSMKAPFSFEFVEPPSMDAQNSVSLASSHHFIREQSECHMADTLGNSIIC
jgi:hypothetical protein